MLLLTSGCKLTPAQYTNVIIWRSHGILDLSKKQFKAKLMFCKPLFIVHVGVKGLLKVILEYKNEVPQLQKWMWHMHNRTV